MSGGYDHIWGGAVVRLNFAIALDIHKPNVKRCLTLVKNELLDLFSILEVLIRCIKLYVRYLEVSWLSCCDEFVSDDLKLSVFLEVYYTREVVLFQELPHLVV